MMEDFAFIGQEKKFALLGFERHEWFDFDTHKFVHFEKKIGEEDSAIEVCFCYGKNPKKAHALQSWDELGHKITSNLTYILHKKHFFQNNFKINFNFLFFLPIYCRSKQANIMRQNSEIRVRIPEHIKKQFQEKCDDELISVSSKVRTLMLAYLKDNS